MIGKNSSGPVTASGVVMNSPGYYYGFTLITGGEDRLFRAWDSPTHVAGTLVENFVCDGSKPADGHDHGGVPVYCASGLYVGVPPGAIATVFFYQFPTQKP